jgi:ABC-type glycerol-3-phosphate transport system substrate-binding protein
MKRNINRRTFLSGAAVGATFAVASPAVLRAYAAGGEITIGTEAGSPYDTFYRKHVQEFTAATGVVVKFNAIPHDSIRQQFVQDALSRAGGFDVYIADQVWLPEFYEKGFISDLSAQLSDADRADFSKTAIQTVSYKGATSPSRSWSIIARCTTARTFLRLPASTLRHRVGTNTERWRRRPRRTASGGP